MLVVSQTHSLHVCLCLMIGWLGWLQCVAKEMVERGEGGAIVNVSSLSSLCALKDHAVYCM